MTLQDIFPEIELREKFDKDVFIFRYEFKNLNEIIKEKSDSVFQIGVRSWCKYPGKPDHSLSEIFRHTDHIPGGDRHAQSTIHRTPDHRRSEVRRSRTHRQGCLPRSRYFGSQLLQLESEVRRHGSL